MAVKLNELLALSYDERIKLAEALMESTVPADMGPLVRELVERLERTTSALDSALERMSTMDERLERVRAEAREAVIRSGERWPFPLPR
jgi:hypothetical protein